MPYLSNKLFIFLLFLLISHQQCSAGIGDFFTTLKTAETIAPSTSLHTALGLSFVAGGTFLVGYGVWTINKMEEPLGHVPAVDTRPLGPGVKTYKGFATAAIGLFCLFKGANIVMSAPPAIINEKY